MSKGSPIPVRFDSYEDEMLEWVSKKTGINKSELIRRSVAMLMQEIRARDGKVGWIVDELMPTSSIAAEDSPPYPAKKAPPDAPTTPGRRRKDAA